MPGTTSAHSQVWRVNGSRTDTALHVPAAQVSQQDCRQHKCEQAKPSAGKAKQSMECCLKVSKCTKGLFVRSHLHNMPACVQCHVQLMYSAAKACWDKCNLMQADMAWCTLQSCSLCSYINKTVFPADACVKNNAGSQPVPLGSVRHFRHKILLVT